MRCPVDKGENHDIITRVSRSGGMADAADSKSVALKSVRVQVPPSAQKESLENKRSQGFFNTSGKVYGLHQYFQMTFRFFHFPLRKRYRSSAPLIHQSRTMASAMPITPMFIHNASM